MKHLLITALLVGTFLSAGCSGKTPDDGSKNYPTQIPSSEKIPVVAWHGVRASHASAERFREAEQMGITLNYSRMGTVEKALEVLDHAAGTGVKLIVECDELYDENKRAAAVQSLKNHKALEGYFVMDEPHPTQFPNIKKMMNGIREVDRGHMCYSNLFPNGGQEFYDALGVKNYEEYVDNYLKECPVTFLSFDKYPIVEIAEGQRAVMAEWYQCLEIIRDRATKADMDFWSFMLTVPHANYPQPTVNDLRLQAYSNLAYGTQVLQCFTYWTPTVADPEKWNYRNGPIAEDGTRTATYDIVKSVLEEIQVMAWAFRGNTVTGVYHTGTPLPTGTQELETLPGEITELSVSRSPGTACVSFFTNHGYNFMMVVNSDINEKCHLSVAAQSHVRRIRKDGSIKPASEDQRTMTLDPGDMLLYMW